MNGSLLLDTNALVAFMKGDAAAVAKIGQSNNAIPVIVVGELYYGAYHSEYYQENITAIENLLDDIVIVNCDAETGRLYGQIKSDLRKLGKPIPENDIWIAAIAWQHGFSVLTRDAHFQAVEAISVVTW